MKATRTLNFIRRNVYQCTAEVKSLAYKALVRPHTEYANAAWDPYLEKDTHCLEMVQRRAARFAYRDYRHTTSVTDLLRDLQWPLLAERRKNSRLTLFFKMEHGLSGVSLDHLQKPTRHTRFSDKTTFQVLLSRTDLYKYSYFPRTIVDWNTLSSETRLKPSVQ